MDDCLAHDDCLNVDKFNCNEAITGDGCMQMGMDNCEATPKALAWPCIFACYGSCACVKFALGVCQECSNTQHTVRTVRTVGSSDASLETIYDGLSLSGDEALGCITCPCLVTIAAVGTVAAIFTWIGSTVCCMVGGCLLYKEKANAVAPENSDQPQDSTNA